MTQQAINVPGLDHPGGVPAACRVGPVVATSVIMGFDPGGKEMPADTDGQARNAFINLKRILTAAGLDLGDVVKVTIYVHDEEDRPIVMKHWAATFPNPASTPARRTLQYKLRKGWRVQLEALAVARDAQ